MATFRCDQCGGEFPVEEGDEAAADEESLRLWGAIGRGREDFDLICDDCFARVDPAAHPFEYLKTLGEMHGDPT